LQISALGIDLAKLFEGVGLIGNQIEHLKVGALCLLTLVEFGVAETHHQVDLEDFGVLVGHDFEFVFRLRVVLFLDQLAGSCKALLAVLVHQLFIIGKEDRRINQSLIVIIMAEETEAAKPFSPM
jgi:hypothetical protein